MRQGQPLGLELEVAEQQQVDVERPRAVARPAEHAPPLDLDRLAEVEQRLGLELGADPDRRVEEVGLVEDLADRLGLVGGGDRLDLHPVLAAAAAIAARRCASRSPTFEPSPRYPRARSLASSSSASSSSTRALVDDLDRDLLDRERQRRLGLGGPDANRLAAEALHQPLADHLAEPLERPVAALGRGEGDDVADLGVVDRVLEAVGEHRVAVGDVEGDVDLEPLADLPLGLADPVVGVDREAAQLDLDR